MPLSNSELVGLFVDTERKLQAICPQSIHYFPVIRSYIYSAQRPSVDDSLERGAGARPVSRVLGVPGSLARVCLGLLSEYDQSNLFVAPARHRNIRAGSRHISKHLDSLLGEYADGSRLVWEVGLNPALPDQAQSLPYHVSRVANLAAVASPMPRPLSQISKAIEDALGTARAGPEIDTARLMRCLHAHDISVAYYRRLFAGSAIRRAYFVVFYSLRHMPIIAALNRLQIETLEYQHGIQNDGHPIYTNWEHVSLRPDTLPATMLLWDEVARARIDRWGAGLGLRTRITGNLWYSNAVRDKGSTGTGECILVALQLYPEYFNDEILEAVRQTAPVRWLFREHPIHPLAPEYRDQLLRDYPNIEIVGARDETLEQSMSRSFCCVTGYSTVGIESLHFGLTAIFTDPYAREGLGDYIDGERCIYAENAADITRVVRAAYDRRRPHE